MFIKMKKLSGKNFMSIGNAPLEFDLTSFTKNMIVGKNGAGKSVIQELISFVLYGVPYRNINKTTLVNTINRKNTETWIEFESNNKNYKIERNIKPDLLKIYEDGVLKPQLSTSKEYQEMLEKTILKFDYSAFCQMNIIGSMGYIPFLQLKANERRVFIESILDLQLFTTMNKSLKTIIADEKTKHSTSNTNLTVFGNKINTYTNVIKDLEAGNDSKKLILDDEILNKKTQYKQAIAKSEKLQTEYDAITVVDFQEFNRLLSACELETRTAENDNIKLLNKIKFFDTTAECSVCNQKIDAKHKQSHLDEYNKTINSNNKIILDNKDKIIEYRKHIKEGIDNQSRQSTAKDKLNSAKVDAEYIKKDIIRIMKDRQALDSTEDNTILNKTKQDLEEAIELRKKEQEIFDNLFTNIQAYDIMLTALKDNGAKAEIVKKYIPIINLTVNNYLEKMGLFVYFELDENFNETLKSRQRDDFNYENFSMGERMRIDIALLFTWREIIKFRTGVDTNLVFFDEVLEILDQEGFEQLLHIVDITPKLNCFIITHKENLEVMFDNVIEIVKVNGFTTIDSKTTGVL